MKKILSLILTLALLIGVAPMQVYATEGIQETTPVEATEEIEKISSLTVSADAMK